MSAQVTITGNLAGDPELRFTSSGKAVSKFTVVSSRSVKKDDGRWEDVDVTYWQVTCWDTLANNVAESLFKGDAVIVTGNAFSESWDDKTTGEKRTKVVVTGRDVALSVRRHPARSTRTQTGRETASAGTLGDDPWAAPRDILGATPMDEAPF